MLVKLFARHKVGLRKQKETRLRSCLSKLFFKEKATTAPSLKIRKAWLGLFRGLQWPDHYLLDWMLDVHHRSAWRGIALSPPKVPPLMKNMHRNSNFPRLLWICVVLSSLPRLSNLTSSGHSGMNTIFGFLNSLKNLTNSPCLPPIKKVKIIYIYQIYTIIYNNIECISCIC